ncbi:MAG: hypothetical protein LBQ83_02790 [Candidatus Margulisbacteria bacterium]|jgi:hypothetical protein|nr:hypothetical protein [Candidatus Margulisiibacteriota bacterium]
MYKKQISFENELSDFLGDTSAASSASKILDKLKSSIMNNNVETDPLFWKQFWTHCGADESVAGLEYLLEKGLSPEQLEKYFMELSSICGEALALVFETLKLVPRIMNGQNPFVSSQKKPETPKECLMVITITVGNIVFKSTKPDPLDNFSGRDWYPTQEQMNKFRVFAENILRMP